MKKLIMSISIIFILLGSALSQQQKGILVMQVTGFENNDGKVVLNLYREQDDIPEKPFKIVTALIENGKAHLQTDEIPYSGYAAIVYHDINNNDVLDHKFFLPAEPMGFSNNWSLSLFSGMPTFEKLKFSFTADSIKYKIKVNWP